MAAADNDTLYNFFCYPAATVKDSLAMKQGKLIRFLQRASSKPSAPFEWAVDGRIPEIGVTCLFGQPGSFKTFAAIDLACCKATGLDCWGQRVGRPRKVIYIAADAPEGVRRRIEAWIIAHWMQLLAADAPVEIDADGHMTLSNLLVYERAVRLSGPRSNSETPNVEEAVEEIKETGLRVDMIILDTLFHSAGNANLLEPREVLPLLVELQKLMNALGAPTSILVHHTTKSGEEFWGSQVFKASTSAMIRFDYEDAVTATVECKRIREGGANFATFAMKFERVKVKSATPDQFGRTESEVLSSVPGAAPTQNKKDKQKEKTLIKNLYVLLKALETNLNNRADNKDIVEALEAEWSRSKTMELIRVAKERNLITGGGGQGEPYSTVPRWALLLLQPHPPGELGPSRESCSDPEAHSESGPEVQNYRSSGPGLLSGESKAVQSSPNLDFWTASNKGSSGPDFTTETELAKAVEKALRQLG